MNRIICLSLLLLLVLAGCNLGETTLTATPPPFKGRAASPTGEEVGRGATPPAPSVIPFTPTPTQTLTRPPTTPPSTPPQPSPTEGRGQTPTTVVPESELCRGGEKLIAVLIDPRLLPALQPEIAQFAADLCAGGHAVRQRALDFANPPALRAYLAALYASSQKKLGGAILIGDAPRAYQWVTLQSANPQIAPTKEEALSYQFYADLDGTFSASAGYQSPGKRTYSYDQHAGNLNWEIWVSLLPMYKGDVNQTIEALRRYFTKNHAYRQGKSDIPRAFMEISEHFASTSAAQDASTLASLTSGPYAWLPWSSAPSARFYFDTKTAALSLAQGYGELSRGAADFAVLDAHGSPLASGQLTLAKVESQPLRTLFLWSNGCAVGNLDFKDNFLTSALYSPTSTVLAAKGTTNNSGGMGTGASGFFGANIARALGQQKSLGEAVLAHINTPLIYPWSESREFHFGTAVLLGDGTLKLREK